MIPNDQIKKQGWYEMKIILDKEMPINKSNRRYIFPFFWSIGILVLVTIFLLWLTHNPESSSISKSETDKKIATASTNSTPKESKYPTKNETLKSKLKPIKIKNLEQKNNSHIKYAETLENNKTKKYSPIFQSGEEVNNDSDVQYQNDNFKEKTISILNELKPKVEITQKDGQEEKIDLSEGLIQNIRQSSTIANIGNQVNYLISNKALESLSLPLTLSSGPLTSKKQNYQFGLALGIGQNLTIKSNNSMQFGFFVEKSLSQKHGIIFTSSIEISRMDLKIKIDTMNSSFSTQFENYVSNSNNQNLDSYFNGNTFNPGFLVQSTGNLSYIRHLNNKFYFQGGIEISYLIDIQEKNGALNKDRNFPSSVEDAKSNLNKLKSIIYNKWDIAPTLGLGYKLSKNISISVQYRHGLVSLIKYPIGSNDYIYFRNSYAKLNYTF